MEEFTYKRDRKKPFYGKVRSEVFRLDRLPRGPLAKASTEEIISNIQEFKDKHGRLPTSKDFDKEERVKNGLKFAENTVRHRFGKSSIQMREELKKLIK